MSSPRPRARPAAGERLPLRLRAPNPPPVFVGRARELEALGAALARGPLCAVSGVGGLGKSALVFQALHVRFPEQVPRTVVIRLGRDEALDQALHEVGRALAEIQGVTGIDWKALLGDRDALVATAIDLAEGPPATRGRGAAPAFWVVIDDLHHADPARAAEVLGQLGRYARKSRWIVAGRPIALPDEALGQTVTLGAMSAAELGELALSWGEGAADERVIAAAAGSPWRLKQLLGGAQPGLEPGSGDPLEDLSPAASAFLADLSVVDADVPQATLARFTEAPAPEVLAALERRGLVERRPRGLRLHEVARAFAAARLGAERARDRRLAAASALLEDAEPELWLEGLRLLIEAGEPARAAAELDRRGPALIEAGEILGLWRVLERAAGAPLASWRLRCASELGDPAALATVIEPPSPTPFDRARWAHALFLQGRHEEAEQKGIEAGEAARAAGDAELACDAFRTAGRAAFAEGAFDRALAMFEALVPVTPRQAAQRDVDIAAGLVSLEQRDAALARVRDVEARLAAEPGLGDGAVHFAVAWVLYQLGSLRLAERASHRLSASWGGVRLHGLASARYLFLAAGIAYDRGAPAEALSALEKLAPLTMRSPGLAPYADLQRALARASRGDLAGLAEEVDRLVETTGPREDLSFTARGLRCRLALLSGDPPQGPPPEITPGRTSWGDYLLLWSMIHRASWGDTAGDPRLVLSAMPEIQALALLARAVRALASGDPDAALTAAEQTAASASASGYGFIEALGREDHAVSALVSKAPAEAVLASAEALSALGRERGLASLVVEAELVALLASPARFDPVKLEPIARSPIAAVASRRARALLGEAAPLDRIDEQVIAAARRRTGCRVETIASGPGAAWGMDDRSSSVWLPDRKVDLADRPLLWRILGVLVGAGGAADKEALVTKAWGQRDYHPLRDDARLHTAIRTLRRLIEEDPARPSRLLTTDDGYALGREAPLRRVVTAS